MADTLYLMSPDPAIKRKNSMIFVDLDGVLADFDASAYKLFGKAPRDIEDEIGSQKFWEAIAGVYDFYLTMPKMADADELWQGVLQYDPHPIILTGVPNSMPQVPNHKRTWCEQYFPGVEVITCYSRNKSVHCQSGDVLIDDWPKYKELWEKAGGIFIVHESAKATLQKLSLQFKNGG